MSVSAHVSLAVAVQELLSGAFPTMNVYPAALDHRLGGDEVKVFAASGEIVAGEEGTVLDVPGTLETVTHFVVQNDAPFGEESAADVVISGGPRAVTVSRGDVEFATNAVEGWAAEAITLTGTAGTPYRVILIGR